jgi:rSAM/selenodomain-associated transferase 2
METVLRSGVSAASMAAIGASAVAISIIVPCWREDAVTGALATKWLAHEAVTEIIVAAAEAPATSHETLPGLRMISCTRRGRGCQMNEAARVAKGNVLLFQHADTELTAAHLQSLCRALTADAGLGGGAFRRQFDERHPHLRWLEPWEALRCRRFGPLFGDQSVFVRRAVFEALGGFADIPLMEDVEFTCRLRRVAPIAVLEPSIRSSPRKHLQWGSWRTTLTNVLLLLFYVCGISPARLHYFYYRRTSAPSSSSAAE